MAKIEIDIELPDVLIQSFLQHVRDYEARYIRETKLKVFVPICGLTGDQMLAIWHSMKPPYGGASNRYLRYPANRGRELEETQ